MKLLVYFVFLLEAITFFHGVEAQLYVMNEVNERVGPCINTEQIGYSQITAANEDMRAEAARVLGGESPRKPYVFPFCNEFRYLMDRDVLEVTLDDVQFVCGYNGTLEENCQFLGSGPQVIIDPQVSTTEFLGITFSSFSGMSTQASDNTTIIFKDVLWTNFEYPSVLVGHEGPITVEIYDGAIESGAGSNLLLNNGGFLTITNLTVSGGVEADVLITSLGTATTSISGLAVTDSSIQSMMHVSSESTLSLLGLSIGTTTMGDEGSVAGDGGAGGDEGAIDDELADLVAFLQTLDVSAPGVFDDPDSPQSMAAQWLAQEDDYFSMGLPLDDPKLLQRYALATFYFATDGDEWTQCAQVSTGTGCRSIPWLLNADECDWFSIFCENGNVTQISFPTGNRLIGALPAELSLLTALERFLAPQNGLFGDIDVSFGGLSSLATLALPDNQFEGPIPVILSLNELDLTDNLFTGVIPSSLLRIPELKDFQAANNLLSGPIPDQIGSLSLLSNLDVQSNLFEGSIPSGLFSLTGLTTLALRENFLSGTMSPLIGRLTSLEVLEMGFTFLNGTLPEEMFQLMNITELELEFNFFSGTISENIRLLNATLMDLFLNNNAFTGSVPEAFDHLTALETLQIQGNQLTGTISDAVCAERGLRFQQLATLIVDCAVECTCCDTCFEE